MAESEIPELPGLIDTHCHPVLLAERGLTAETWRSVEEARLAHVIAVGTSLADSEQSAEIARARADVSFTVGWHPQEPAAPDAAQVERLDALLRDPRAVGVGEIGLDLYFRPGYHETDEATQTRGLHVMFELAEQHRKPVVLHDRDAHEQILAVMRAHPGVQGVMHCFSGDASFADRCLELGYVISFSGIVTFRNAQPIQQAAAHVPDGHFVVETDAPFLAPVPMRGHPNLPGYVRATAAAVARLRDASPESVAAQTSATARRVFGLQRAAV